MIVDKELVSFCRVSRPEMTNPDPLGHKLASCVVTNDVKVRIMRTVSI